MIPYQKQWEVLQNIPGLDAISAAMLLVEIWPNMRCYGGSARLASWAVMCPRNNESAGKHKGGRTRKGNHVVRRLLCEVSNAANKTKSQSKGLYQIRRGHMRAIIAVGYKILRVVFAMLRDFEPYRDPQIDYICLVGQRKAPRWLTALK